MDEPKKVIKYSASQPLSSLNYTDIAAAVSKLKQKVIAFADFCRINFILSGAGLDSNIEVYHYDDGVEPEMGVMFSAEYINIHYAKELAEYNLWKEKRELELQIATERANRQDCDRLQRKIEESTASFNKFKGLINKLINERTTSDSDGEVLEKIRKMVQHCK